MKIGSRFFKVERYIPKIRVCTSCHRYGHLANTCKAQPRCKACGNVNPDHEHLCSSHKCLACFGSGHFFGNRNCPVLKLLIANSIAIYERRVFISDIIKSFFNNNKALRSQKEVEKTFQRNTKNHPPEDGKHECRRPESASTRFNLTPPSAKLLNLPPLREQGQPTALTYPSEGIEAIQPKHPTFSSIVRSTYSTPIWNQDNSHQHSHFRKKQNLKPITHDNSTPTSNRESDDMDTPHASASGYGKGQYSPYSQRNSPVDKESLKELTFDWFPSCSRLLTSPFIFENIMSSKALKYLVTYRMLKSSCNGHNCSGHGECLNGTCFCE
ncbi:hypothetical protein GE061_008709, partial [Apolygus lucorum]